MGLVETSEDFGNQGALASHPELLDWLAVEFRKSGWDVKALMKLIVMSRTYRQSSVMTPVLAREDPRNRMLARGPRIRLDAEMLRDQALHASGLLVTQMGGPGVKPPQPEGLLGGGRVHHLQHRGIRAGYGAKPDLSPVAVYVHQTDSPAARNEHV
jgi:hypothetical protein